MLKVIERNITLQLLVFYGLFVLPLLLGGIELYTFQRDAWQQSAQRSDLGLAQAIAFDVATNVHATEEEAVNLATLEAAQTRQFSQSGQLNQSQANAIFAAAYTAYPAHRLYIICNTSGNVLLTYPSYVFTTSKVCANNAYIQRVLVSSTPVIGMTQLSQGVYVVPFAVPMLNAAHHPVGVMLVEMSLQSLNTQLLAIRQQLTSGSEANIWVIAGNGQPLADTTLVAPLPTLHQLSAGRTNSQIIQIKGRDWLYSSTPVTGTSWTVTVARPTDVTFTVVASFQHSLLIALLMLLVGASLFWFVMHGWVVAPLAHLAQVVAQIKPDQTGRIMESKLIARERSRTDEIGRLIAACSVMEDEIHTLFRKSDERSQVRLHTLDAIMRSMNEGVVLESSEGEVVYANHSFTRSVGLAPQEYLEDAFNEKHLMEKLLTIVEEPDAYQEAIARAESGEGPQELDFQTSGIYNQVGQLVPVRRDVRVHLFQVRDQTGQVIGRGKIFNDVTKQNEAEQVKKNLLAIISHELRTPLTAIKGYATSLLATDIEVDDALRERFLQRIVEEGDRMANLVTDLLEMSQLEAGTLKLSPALYALDVLLEQSIGVQKRSQINVNIPADLPPLYVDGRRIEMVLRNLLENAWCYAGQDAHVSITARYQVNDGVYIDIADDGPGLPLHQIERIFDRFYQIDSGRKRSSNGVGLGLAICRGFLEAHGGRIWAENRSDGVSGAVFHLWLPAKVVYLAQPQSALFTLDHVI